MVGYAYALKGDILNLQTAVHLRFAECRVTERA